MTSLRIAELTAARAGGVAVLEVRGRGALERVAELAPKARLRVGRATLARLVTGRDSPGDSLAGKSFAGELLDEGLLIPISAQRVELHLHGSPAVVRAVRRALGRTEPLSSEASGGSIESRARARLARTRGPLATRVLLDQLGPGRGAPVGAGGALRTTLERALLRSPIDWRATIDELLDRGRRARFLFAVPRIVLLGPVNAGKSTLFNLLVGERRALVSERAGTTRDAVAERALFDGVEVELVDTAGARSAVESEIERSGQALAVRTAERADLVLRLHHGGDEPGAPAAPGGTPELVFVSRADRARMQSDERALASIEEPSATRARVSSAVLSELGLGAADSDWARPGRALPFEPELQVLLEAARSCGSCDARRIALAPLLARG